MQMATIKTQMQSKGNEANDETLSSLLSPASNALSLEEAQAKFGVLGVLGLAYPLVAMHVGSATPLMRAHSLSHALPGAKPQ